MKINIGLPIDLSVGIETRFLIQANSGGGKSYAIRRLLEATAGKVQQIVLDLEGEFATLRERYDFVVFGEAGDYPIHLKYAEKMARMVLELNISAIIDLYELKHHERITFVKRFLDSMINAPKTLWHPCLVVVDEAHIFCPEKSKAESMSSVIELCTRGRKRGYCAVLATQRLSKLHKDAAAECNNKLIGRTGLDVDMKRAGEELGFTTRQDILALRSLQPGEFFAFGPAITNEITKFKVDNVITTHPKTGARISHIPPASVKVKKILEQLKDLPQEAEQEIKTLQDAKREIQQLKTKLTVLEKGKKGVQADPEMIRKLKNNIEELKKENYGIIRKDEEMIKKINLVSERIKKIMQEGLAQLEKMIIPEPAEILIKDYKPIYSPIFGKVSKPILILSHQHKGYQPTEKIPPGSELGAGERKVLIAIAQHQDGVDREQLTILTGYKRSSRDAYIQRLQQKGLCRVEGWNIFATEDGIEVLGGDFEPLPTGEALREYWLNRLSGGERSVFELLIESYPDSISREEISERTSYKRSSRDAYIQRLAQRKLVVPLPNSEVKASDKLF